MTLRLLALCVLAGFGTPEAGAQAIGLGGGNVQITVPFVSNGFGTGVNTSSFLQWRGVVFGATHKITAQTATTGQKYGFTVRATGVTNYGASAGTVTLAAGAPPRDLIRNIPSSFAYIFGAFGQATLRYEATATAANPAGQDFHTVTYTITQQ